MKNRVSGDSFPDWRYPTTTEGIYLQIGLTFSLTLLIGYLSVVDYFIRLFIAYGGAVTPSISGVFESLRLWSSGLAESQTLWLGSGVSILLTVFRYISTGGFKVPGEDEERTRRRFSAFVQFAAAGSIAVWLFSLPGTLSGSIASTGLIPDLGAVLITAWVGVEANRHIGSSEISELKIRVNLLARARDQLGGPLKALSKGEVNWALTISGSLWFLICVGAGVALTFVLPAPRGTGDGSWLIVCVLCTVLQGVAWSMLFAAATQTTSARVVVFSVAWISALCAAMLNAAVIVWAVASAVPITARGVYWAFGILLALLLIPGVVTQMRGRRQRSSKSTRGIRVLFWRALRWKIRTDTARSLSKTTERLAAVELKALEARPPLLIH